MKYLITGSEGFVGSHLMDIFPGSIGIDNRALNKIKRSDTIVKDIVLDPVDKEVKECSMVIHCACSDIRTSMAKPFLDLDVNIKGTLKLLDACRRYNKSFLYISSVSVHAEKSHYAISKRAGERYAIMYRQWIPACIIRLSNVYGERDTESVIAKWLSENTIKLINPKATRDFVYIKDVQESVKLSIEKWPQDIIDIGTGCSENIGDLAFWFSNKLNKPIEIVSNREIDNVVDRQVDWIPAFRKLDFRCKYSIYQGLKDMGFND